MAETIISPGVFQRENDISFIQPAPATVGAAIIGPAVKGPVELPTIVTSYNDYVRQFGTTFSSGSNTYEYLTSIAVKSYFDQGGENVLVSRVVSGSSDWTSVTNTPIYATSKEGGLLVLSTLDIDTNSTDAVDDTYIAAALTTNGSGTGAQATVVVSGNEVTSVTITAAGSGHAIGDNLTIPASVIGGNTNVVLADLQANNIVNSEVFTLKTHGKGTIYNNQSGSVYGQENSDGSLVSGSQDNLRWQISNVDTAKGTFTVQIRRGDDNRNNKIVLETFNDVSLDPNSNNYISAVIGDQVQSISADSTFISISGSYPAKSKFVYVASVNLPTLNYLGADGSTIGTDNTGLSYSASLPAASSGSFYGGVGSNVRAGVAHNYFNEIDAQTQGLLGRDYNNIITLLENKDDFLFNIISVPGLTYQHHSIQIDSLKTMVESRGDAIAVIDLVGHGSTVPAVTSQATSLNTSYAAAYWPWLTVRGANGANRLVPASTVIPGVYAFTDNAAAPWFAPAGLVRGGLPGVIQAERKLTRAHRDSLYSGKVNPIATFPGTGIAVFGQKTLQTKASALDRVNVRRLLIDLKKFVGDQAKNLVFEQNTIATRNRFLSAVNPYMESVVQRQGLYAFRVVMDDSNNTADVVDRNQLVGQIFIQPAKTAEFIVLDFVVEPTGATFGA